MSHYRKLSPGQWYRCPRGVAVKIGDQQVAITLFQFLRRDGARHVGMAPIDGKMHQVSIVLAADHLDRLKKVAPPPVKPPVSMGEDAERIGLLRFRARYGQDAGVPQRALA